MLLQGLWTHGRRVTSKEVLGLASVIIGFLGHAQAAQAIPEEPQARYIDGKKYASGPSPWSGSLSAGYGRSIIENDDAFFSESLSFDVGVSRSFLWGTTVSLSGGAVRELDDELGETSINATSVGISVPLTAKAQEGAPPRVFSSAVSVSTVLPTNTESASHTSFQGALALRPSASWKMRHVAVGHSLALGLSASYRENFYVYDTSKTGGRNVARTLTPGLSVTYAWHPKWTLSLSGGHTTAIDTFGEYYDGTYSHSEVISYQMDPAFGLSFGHALEDTSTQYDRVTSNIRVVDIASSQVFAEATYSF